MRFLSFLMVVLFLGVACSSGQVDTVRQPSVDIGATVDAAVEATRVAERESWTPVPTATLLPTLTAVPTATLVPTPTPAPTATIIPTPEPYVASPGSVEVGMERLSRCFRESESFGELMVEMLVASGDTTPEEAEAYVVLLGHEEFWELMIAEGTEDDLQLAQMMSLLGTMSEELCPSDFQSSDAGGEDPGDSNDVGFVGSEIEDLAGELFDCLQEDDEYAERFWLYAENVGGLWLVEGIRSDRELFVDGVGASAVISGFESGLGVILEEECR